MSWINGCQRVAAVAAVASLIASEAGCATVQSRYLAAPLDRNGKPLPQEATASGLVISGNEQTELASPLIGALEVTFENRSTHWSHLHVVSVRFGSQSIDQTVTTPTGPDLLAWQRAILRRNQIRAANTELALAISTSVILTSQLATHHAGGTAPAAGLITVASVGALLASEANAAAEYGGVAALFPTDHLLNGSISVPPGLFAKRWIVFYTPDPKLTGCLRRVQLGYQLDDGRTEYVLLPFRDEYVRSEWQAEVCESAAGWQGH